MEYININHTYNHHILLKKMKMNIEYKYQNNINMYVSIKLINFILKDNLMKEVENFIKN